MNNKSNAIKMDMISGSIWDKLILFAIPLALSSILQQLFNSVDVAIAGRFAGTEALAAVGANSSLINLFVNLFVGLGIGTNVVISMLIGQNKTKEVNKVVHTSIVLGFVSGLLLIAILFPLGKTVLALIRTPEDVIDLATVYLRIYILGMPFILIYNYGAAILRSVGDTRRPMIALTVSGVINVILNLLLVIQFSLGVAGVAIATVISNIVSSSVVIIILMREDEMIRFSPKLLSIDKKYLKKVLAIGLPAGIQGALFSLSNVILQSGINSFGKTAIAGSSTGLNFEYFSFYVSNSFSQAAVTFVSQNYGASNFDRCRKVCRIAILEGVLFTEILSIIFIIFRTPLCFLYTDDSAVVTYAIMRMVRVTAVEGMTCVYECCGGTMRGMGHSTLPAVLSILGTVVFRVVWMLTVFSYSHTFQTLMLVYPASWIFNIILMCSAYFIVMSRMRKNR